MEDKFYSKILMFGEYAVVKGGKGLAIPCKKYFGSLKFSDDQIPENLRLNEFAKYIHGRGILKKLINTEQLLKDVDDGLYFESNIPYGHGVGSSGALCASLFAKYAFDFNANSQKNADELSTLQDIMALMESFYHGTSSGIDCLISLINKPVLINSRNELQVYEMPKLTPFGKFYLYESGINRKTAPFVHQFLKDYNESDSFKKKFSDFINYSDAIIESVTTDNIDEFRVMMKKISHWQFLYMQKMIPDNVKEFWAEGLETEAYFVKLCGAGGGGFFLVYSNEEKLMQNNLIPLEY